MSFNSLVFINNVPCIILIVATIIVLLLSKLFKDISSIFRIMACVIFLIQIIWQISIGSSFLEMLLVWSFEGIMFYATMPSLLKDIKKQENIKKEEE